MYKKNYFFLFFFIVLAIISLVKLYDYAINHDMWEYGEWLINYQHGFVRRGIIGEFIFLLSKIFQHNIEIAYFIVLSIIVVLYYLLNYIFLKDIKLNFVNLLIIFSPLFYLFFIVISKVRIRKEIILYTFYLFYLIHLSSNDFTLKKNWKFILLFPILLLNHEGTFFYLPYLIIPLLFIVKNNKKKELIYQISALFIISILVEILLFYNKGTTDHTLSICKSLGNFAPDKCTWWGPFFGLGQTLGDDFGSVDNKDWFFYKVNFKTYLGFFFYIFYAFLPIFCFITLSRFQKNYFLVNKKVYILILLLTFLYSLPLFLLVHDWSRWFSIHFHLLAYLLFFLQQKNLAIHTHNSNFIKINNYLLSKKLRTYFFIFLFIYTTLLHHQHFFFEGLKLELTYYKVFTKIKDIF